MKDTETINFQKRVISNIEDKIAYYDTLISYTNKTVKLKQHKENKSILEDVLESAKEEYGMV